MKEKTVQLNVPIRIEQVEKLSKAVAIVMASRERNADNERVTKATFIRSLIDVISFDQANLRDISNEQDLQNSLKEHINKDRQSSADSIDIDVLSSIYKKFADDDQKKWVAGDFINTLYEKGLIEAQSSDELWGKILKKVDDATK